MRHSTQQTQAMTGSTSNQTEVSESPLAQPASAPGARAGTQAQSPAETRAGTTHAPTQAHGVARSTSNETRAPEPAMPQPATRDDAPSHDEIARRAHAIHVKNGRRNGRCEEDWRLAEAELRGQQDKPGKQATAAQATAAASAPAKGNGDSRPSSTSQHDANSPGHSGHEDGLGLGRRHGRNSRCNDAAQP